jgi:hypothetical protein
MGAQCTSDAYLGEQLAPIVTSFHEGEQIVVLLIQLIVSVDSLQLDCAGICTVDTLTPTICWIPVLT